MNVNVALSLLAQDPAADLDPAALALALAQDEYPDLDAEGYLSELDAMAHDLRPQLRGGLTPRVEALARYLFDDLGFHGNQRHYYDPRNSYLNQVLDRRTGLPITLSLVALAVGNRAGLRVAGVGLPGHFIAKAMRGSEEILFDPFHGGRLLERTDCQALVERATGQPFQVTPAALEAQTTSALVTRLLMNLKNVYLQEKDFGRTARILGRLCQLHPDDPVQRRDLGSTLLQTGQPGKAVDHLAAYLQAVPQAVDAAQVRQLLQRAWGTVARWN
jgi:regulator of sirC expression with transglutaminase-like and TPR domain